MIIITNNLLNGSAKAMNVNGSVTPQVFSYSPGNGYSAGIIGITCLLTDEGITALTKLGAITALTNGILIQVIQGGVTRTLTTIKDNADLCTRFHFNQFGNGAILSILSIVTPEGFGNSNNIFVGYMEFPESKPIILNDTDIISVTIQDNLTSIDLLQMACKAIQD